MKTPRGKRQSGFTLIEYIVGLVVVSIIAAMIYNIMGTSLTKSGLPIQNLQKASDLSNVMENIIADYNRLNEINMRYKWRSSRAYHLNSIVLPSTGDDNDASTIKNNGRYYKCTTAGTSSANQPATWPVTSGLTGTVSDGAVAWKEQGRVWLKSTSYSLGDIVVPVINNGHYYKSTQAGTSAVNEPSSTNATPNPWLIANNATVTDGGVIWTEVGTILYSADTTNTILKDNLYNYLNNTPGRYDNNKNSYTVVETKFIQFNGTSEVDAGTSGTSSENNILKVTIKDNNSGSKLTELFTIR
jgi:prepilin-type N-terminal cleavage/methylation domain-containing protein